MLEISTPMDIRLTWIIYERRSDFMGNIIVGNRIILEYIYIEIEDIIYDVNWTGSGWNSVQGFCRYDVELSCWRNAGISCGLNVKGCKVYR